MRRTLSFTLLFLTIAQGVLAKPKTVREELPEAVRRSWDTAGELYGVGDFAGARAEYRRVYEATKNPRVLYNIAVCEKDLKHYKAAVDTLKRALEKKTELPREDVQRIEEAIAAIEPFITKVEVTANEPGASLFIDDVEIGTTPFAGPIEVDAGSHTVRLTKPGFIDDVQKTTFTTAGMNKLNLRITPAVRRAHVTIRVVGAPSSTIWIDGRERGPAPFDGELEEGEHDIEARADQFVPTKQHVTIVYKTDASFVLALARARHEGVLRVVAKPENATIEIDGKIVGRGEWEGPLASKGGHQLVVRKDGYYTYSSEVVLDDDQRRVVPVTLNAEKTWIFWAIGGSVILAGGIVAGYFAFRAPDRPVVPGTLDAGGAGYGLANFHFH